MKQKITWSAQLITIGLCALALKVFYSNASPDELRWILGPTTFLVELLSGKSFAFEAHSGYMSGDHTFLIAASCAGVNFLLTSFLLLSLRMLWHERGQGMKWQVIPLAAAGAYAGTLIANTVRICVALYLLQNPPNIGLNAAQVHRLEGIIVYFSFLLFMYLLVERVEKSDVHSLLKLFAFPLAIYYFVTIAMPLANGSFHVEHFAFVLVVPLVIVLLSLSLRLCSRKSLKDPAGG